MFGGCFRPDVPSKKTIILDLNKTREVLEQENNRLRHRVEKLDQETYAFDKEREDWNRLRRSYETALQKKSQVTAECASKCSKISSVLAAVLQESKQKVGVPGPASRITSITVDVAAYEPESDAELGDMKKRQQDAGDCVSMYSRSKAQGPTPESVLETTLSKLESEGAVLAQALNEALKEVERNRSYNQSLEEQLSLAKSQREQTEQKAKSQQEVLELRCTALEHENQGLNDLNNSLQATLERVQSDLNHARQQLSSAQSNASKSQADLSSHQGLVSSLEAELNATQAILVSSRHVLAARSEELDTLKSEHSDNITELKNLQAALPALQSELKQAREQHTAAVADLQQQLSGLRQRAEEAEVKLPKLQQRAEVAESKAAAMQKDLQEARHCLALCQQQVSQMSADVASTGNALREAQQRVAAAESERDQACTTLMVAQKGLEEMTEQYMAAKKDLVNTAKQLAAMAKDHNKALDKLSGNDDALSSAQLQMRNMQAALAASVQEANECQQRLKEYERGWPQMQEELQALSGSVAQLGRQVDGKKALLAAIARLSQKGGQKQQGTASAQDESSALAYYKAALNDRTLRLKICDTPLALCGSVLAGIADSKQLESLVLDIDTSKEAVWEKAGLRAACLAAALGLNSSLQSLELTGWTWDELGNGCAAPFLTLGSSSGPRSLTMVTVDTKLFDVDSAAVLKDLLQRGLVELKKPSGQGVLRLYCDSENLDEWYGHMIKDAAAPGSQQQGPQPGRITADGSAPADGPSLSTHSMATSTISTASTAIYANPSSPGQLLVHEVSMSININSITEVSSVDSDLSNESLESHHMVVVMAVLLTCPHLKRLSLDGNKIGDLGAEILSLGLSSNGSLRELSLARNSIRAAGARKLGQGLAASGHLRRLDVSSQRFDGMGPQGAEALASSLRHVSSLEELQAGGNHMGPLGASALVSLLRSLPPAAALKRLGAPTNDFDSASTKALKAAAAERGVVINL